MKYNQLGKSDLSISEISFGCMSLGSNHDENFKLLHQAFNNGINYFDTADVYSKGENETTLGKAFKGIRDKVIIATKVGNEWSETGDSFNWNPTKKHILKSVEESLQRLQTDYIDLYQLHGGTIEDPIDETIEAFELLKKQGKIRYYGISSIRPNVIREYIKRSNISSVMMQYSLLDRRPEESCLDLLHQNNISALARGTVAKGLLAGKSAAPFMTYSQEEVEQVQNEIKRLSNSSRSESDTAIRFVLHNPVVASAVIGIRTSSQLEAALKASESSGLSDAEIESLEKSIQPIYYDQHR